MDGKCFVCAVKFTFFNREYACQVCRHSVCKNCLVEAKSLKSNRDKICTDCRNKQKEKSTLDNALDPPKFLQKLDDPPPYPGPGPSKPKLTRRVTDDDIQARLDALKGSNKRTITKQMSEYELQSKVNKLMGKPPPVREPVIQLYVNTKSQSKQTDDLIDQINEECNLKEGDPKPSGLEDLEARAKALRTGVSTTTAPRFGKDSGLRDISGLTEAQQVEYILRQAHEEAMLDLNAGYVDRGNSGGEDDTPVDEKLPWCCICNNDAEVVCPECDSDLYCKRCYREGHSEYGLDDHNPYPFKKSEKQRKMEL